MLLKAFVVHILRCIKIVFVIYISKWRLYTMTTEKLPNLRESAASSTTAVIFAIKNFLIMMNWSNKIRIRFLKCWILINLGKFKVEVHIFHKKNGQKLPMSRTICTIFNKKYNLIRKKCAKFRVDWMKIVWLPLNWLIGYEAIWKTRFQKNAP